MCPQNDRHCAACSGCRREPGEMRALSDDLRAWQSEGQ